MAVVVSLFSLSPNHLGDQIPKHSYMASRLATHGGTLVFVTLTSKWDDTFRATATGGLEVQILPLLPTQRFRLVMSLLKLITSRRVTVFHMNFIHWWTAVLLMSLTRLLLRRTVFIYHKQSSGKILLSKFNPKKYLSPLRLLSLFCDSVVCVSDSIVQNCINRCVHPSKLRTIYNGVRVERFENAENTGRIRREFGIPEDYRIISVIKEARPEVGLEDLLLSIPHVLAAFPKTIFLLVGGGAGTDRLRSLAETLEIEKNVIFAGIRHDIPDIIAESYFTVAPSPVEGFANVVLESMAGRRPVIGVNSWGSKEAILDGKTGLLVEPGNPTRFAPAIIELLSSPQRVEDMGQKSLHRVKDLFSMERVADEWVSLWVEYLKDP